MYRLQSCDGFLPCPGFTPDSLVQRTRMRVRLLGSRICHKSHAIQFTICAPVLFYAHKKTSPALLSCRQKKSRVLCIFGLIARKKYQAIRLVGWLVGWLVARTVPIIYIYITIYHARVHLLSRIYIPILPQSGVIVKRKIFRGFGRIFGKDFSLLQPEQPVSRIYPANPVVMDFRVVVHSEKDFRIVIFDCTQRAQFSLKCLFITNR